MNGIYRGYFAESRLLARTCVGVTGLAYDALIEIRPRRTTGLTPRSQARAVDFHRNNQMTRSWFVAQFSTRQSLGCPNPSR
jgi:hypothetical protein